jgi:hypothetical protein
MLQRIQQRIVRQRAINAPRGLKPFRETSLRITAP